MKKIIAAAMVLCLLLTAVSAFAESRTYITKSVFNGDYDEFTPEDLTFVIDFENGTCTFYDDGGAHEGIWEDAEDEEPLELYPSYNRILLARLEDGHMNVRLYYAENKDAFLIIGSFYYILVNENPQPAAVTVEVEAPAEK